MELVVRLGPAPESPLTILACFDVATGKLRWIMQEPDGFLPPTLVDREPGTARRILVSSPSLETHPLRTHLVSADGQTQPLAQLPPSR